MSNEIREAQMELLALIDKLPKEQQPEAMATVTGYIRGMMDQMHKNKG